MSEPGDLVALVARLRNWAAERDTDRFLLDGSFEAYGLDVERAVAAARPLVQGAATAVFQVAALLQKSAAYKQATSGSGGSNSSGSSNGHARKEE